jgi:hypothetical protein
MTKTDKMLLIEAKDPEGRDIREIIATAYNETGSVEKAAEWINEQFGVSVSWGVLHDWIQAGGGTITRTVSFPRCVA